MVAQLLPNQLVRVQILAHLPVCFLSKYQNNIEVSSNQVGRLILNQLIGVRLPAPQPQNNDGFIDVGRWRNWQTRLAQNQDIAGSTPVRPIKHKTNKPKKTVRGWVVTTRQSHYLEIVGANPAPATIQLNAHLKATKSVRDAIGRRTAFKKRVMRVQVSPNAPNQLVRVWRKWQTHLI